MFFYGNHRTTYTDTLMVGCHSKVDMNAPYHQYKRIVRTDRTMVCAVQPVPFLETYPCC